MAEQRRVAQFRQPFPQRRFRPPLRDHPRDGVGFGWRGRRIVHQQRLRVGAVGIVDALRRVEAARRRDPVQHPEILEDLLGSRLDAFPARTAKGLRCLLDEGERHVPAREIDGQREASSAGAADQNAGVEDHCSLPLGVLCTYDRRRAEARVSA